MNRNPQIYDANQTFPFDKLKLNNLLPTQKGTFNSLITINDQNVLIKLPSCETKSGIQKTDKKIFSQLKFSNNNPNHINVIEWYYQLEERIHHTHLRKTS